MAQECLPWRESQAFRCLRKSSLTRQRRRAINSSRARRPQTERQVKGTLRSAAEITYPDARRESKRRGDRVGHRSLRAGGEQAAPGASFPPSPLLGPGMLLGLDRMRMSRCRRDQREASPDPDSPPGGGCRANGAGVGGGSGSPDSLNPAGSWRCGSALTAGRSPRVAPGGLQSCSSWVAPAGGGGGKAAASLRSRPPRAAGGGHPGGSGLGGCAGGEEGLAGSSPLRPFLLSSLSSSPPKNLSSSAACLEEVFGSRRQERRGWNWIWGGGGEKPLSSRPLLTHPLLLILDPAPLRPRF